LSRFLSETRSRFRFCQKSFLRKSYERELRRTSTGHAFVIMQTKDQKHDTDHGQAPERRFDIQAIGLDTRKRHGEVAEARFLAKASSMGFGVAKPWGDERYDFIVDSGHRFWRVQVKSTRRPASPGYTIVVASCVLASYDETQIDFLVAYLVPEDAWYVIPVKMLKARNSLSFFPRGQGKAKWEKYREAWCQMACPHDENGPSKIVTPRCCDKGPTRLPICPLKLLR
jgi:hypothetical protein